MKRDKKTTYKEDMQAYIVMAVLWLIIGLVVGLIGYSLSDKEKTYEYAKNCEIGRSSECYLDDEGRAYCVVNDEKISVDNYYEVEK